MFVSESAGEPHWWEYGKRRELLFGAFLLTRKSFPCFNFHPLPTASIHFKNINIAEAISRTVGIINGKYALPCLYNPYTSKVDDSDPVGYIEHIRSLEAYIDLFNAPQVPFAELVSSLQAQYTICDQYFRPEFVAELYQRINGSSRLIQIAVHYFVNAARLVHEQFTEDAGLNLNLVLEAIIEDVVAAYGLKDKKQAIKILKDRVALPYGHMEFLEDLYEARNEFLAHIDKEMFTEKQNICEPDRYCCEHFESVSWLIRRYIKHRSNEQSTTQLQS